MHHVLNWHHTATLECLIGESTIEEVRYPEQGGCEKGEEAPATRVRVWRPVA